MAADNDKVFCASHFAAMSNVAVVVGTANNLGFHVLKKLSQKYNGKIYFTTDDDTTGYKILENLKNKGNNIEYFRVDVTYTKSIINFRHHIQDLDERIDLLINNTDYISTEKKLSRTENVRRILSVNFYGYINFGNLIYPLLTECARVINVSGAAGLLATIENEEIRNRISDPNIREDDLVAVMQEYEEAVRKGVEKTEGWGVKVQSVSKVALNAITFLQHRDWSHKGIVINCVNPGDVSHKENRRSVKVFENGANAILYLAFEAPLTIKGNFVWSNFNVMPWNGDPYVEVTTV